MDLTSGQVNPPSNTSHQTRMFNEMSEARAATNVQHDDDTNFIEFLSQLINEHMQRDKPSGTQP